MRAVLAFALVALLAAPAGAQSGDRDRLDGLTADSLRRPTTPEGRMAYWCLADRYRDVAARSSDPNVSAAAARAARQYERAGPSPDVVRALGLTPGETVEVDLGTYGRCRTVVRGADSGDG